MPRAINIIVACLAIAATSLSARAATHAQSSEAKVVRAANRLLDLSNLSYVYGGNTLGQAGECEACSKCLETRRPAPKDRLSACPACKSCSLDCSHFTHLVFKMAGFEHPYLPTALMISLSRQTLLDRYKLVDLGKATNLIQTGDLLVYPGHVVMVEAVHGPDRVDVIHATSGRDLKIPGQGIQRERFATASSFRGPLQRILRHSSLTPGAGRLRPVAKRDQGASRD